MWTTWLTDWPPACLGLLPYTLGQMGYGKIYSLWDTPQTCSDVMSVKCVPHLPRSYEHYTQSIKRMDLAESLLAQPLHPPHKAVLDIKERI